MTDRPLRPRLQDILENIDIVAGAVGKLDFGRFAADPILRLAVERAIEIISEAVRHIPESDRNGFRTCRGATSWRSATSFGMSITASTSTSSGRLRRDTWESFDLSSRPS
jgi:uncharacterized protein with HEPN domain